jgi:Amidohydrolase family/3-beta hydroxysteroid dehydrogenase/isomerase family
MSHEIVIRGGTIVDGTGAEPFAADLAIDDGRITAMGSDLGGGREVIDARGLTVTPGFVDIHTHLDAQIRSADGPVAVTGASGHIGSHVVLALVKPRIHGARLRHRREQAGEDRSSARDEQRRVSGARRTSNRQLAPGGQLRRDLRGLRGRDLCRHADGYANLNKPRQIYDGAVNGTKNVLESVKKAGSARRVVYTSSFAAIAHPAPPGYVFSEKDWASDNRGKDASWTPESIDTNGDVAYAMGKIATEQMAWRVAEEDRRFDVRARSWALRRARSMTALRDRPHDDRARNRQAGI